MADLFQSSSRIHVAIWAVKLVLLSLGIISTFIFFKIAIIPYLFSILSSLPCLWVSFRSLLSPPYIYIILNFIILTIIAASSSAFHSQTHFPKTVSYKKPVHNNNISLPDIIFKESMEEYPGEKFMEGVPSLETCSDDSCVTDSEESHRIIEKVIEEEQKQSQRGWSDFDETSVSAMPEDYSEEKTLEETWRMIMEGEGKTKEKQLKKSETWERTRKAADGDSVSLIIRRREISINGEELKEQTEAFIKRFKNQMRLQKQESDQRFKEMVSRGVY